jgi:phosphoglycerate dehydrogenase-like enzyme
MPDVLCLRPKLDFTRVGVTPPPLLDITYLAGDDSALPQAIRTADALVIPAVGPKIPADLFKESHTRLIQVTGAGVDRLDVPSLRQRGIAVANVPGGSNAAVAEYVLSSASVLLRRMTRSTAAIRRGEYTAYRNQTIADNVDGLDGAIAGVVGMGVIGTAVARRLRQAGARIVCYDPAPTNKTLLAEIDAEPMELDALVRVADIVTVHVPLVPATVDLIDARRIAMMKVGAVLVQAARGSVVNETALAASLESGHLAGAAVDVYSSEPPSPTNPLLAMSDKAAERAILTPHIAGITRQSWAFLFDCAWKNVTRVLIDNEPPENLV